MKERTEGAGWIRKKEQRNLRMERKRENEGSGWVDNEENWKKMKWNKFQVPPGT